MKRVRRLLPCRVGLCLLIVTIGAANAAAQSDTGVVSATPPDTTAAQGLIAMDSAFARARRMVIAGQTAAGRQIGDSILKATPPGTSAYGNALYGMAMLAPTAADAQLDYQRIAVEYPFSPHAGDALLKLAQLERSGGDRASAIRHLQRFLRENPTSPQRPEAGLWLAQLIFEQGNNDEEACGILDTAKAATPPTNVEMLNQINFYSGRCAMAAANAAADSAARADSIRKAVADSVARADSVRRAAERARAARTRKGAGRAAPEYSVQLAAFNTKADAERLVRSLQARGVNARVDGTQKPFRVRTGHYATRAEATRALAALKKLGYAGFVTTVDHQ